MKKTLNILMIFTLLIINTFNHTQKVNALDLVSAEDIVDVLHLEYLSKKEITNALSELGFEEEVVIVLQAKDLDFNEIAYLKAMYYLDLNHDYNEIESLLRSNLFEESEILYVKDEFNKEIILKEINKLLIDFPYSRFEIISLLTEYDSLDIEYVVNNLNLDFNEIALRRLLYLLDNNHLSYAVSKHNLLEYGFSLNEALNAVEADIIDFKSITIKRLIELLVNTKTSKLAYIKLLLLEEFSEEDINNSLLNVDINYSENALEDSIEFKDLNIFNKLEIIKQLKIIGYSENEIEYAINNEIHNYDEEILSIIMPLLNNKNLFSDDIISKLKTMSYTSYEINKCLHKNNIDLNKRDIQLKNKDVKKDNSHIKIVDTGINNNVFMNLIMLVLSSFLLIKLIRNKKPTIG